MTTKQEVIDTFTRKVFEASQEVDNTTFNNWLYNSFVLGNEGADITIFRYNVGDGGTEHRFYELPSGEVITVDVVGESGGYEDLWQILECVMKEYHAKLVGTGQRKV